MKPLTPFTDLPYESWKDTKDTIHLFLQIVGKVRLALFPKKNHWWHVPFYVSVNGLTTGPIPVEGKLIEMEFDFHNHTLNITSSRNDSVKIDLAQHSVAEFYDKVFDGLRQLDIEAEINPKPYDIPHIQVEHFHQCSGYDTYDKAAAETMWQILIDVNTVFEEFRGHFVGKSTPVHLFWHHFDLALTRFSGKRAPERPGVSQVEREAYSHEVISFGFWFGDENVQEPAFYAYGFPPPDSVYNEVIAPAEAAFNPDAGMALLKYNDIRTSDDPAQKIMDFLDSTFNVYAKHMDWTLDEF